MADHARGVLPVLLGGCCGTPRLAGAAETRGESASLEQLVGRGERGGVVPVDSAQARAAAPARLEARTRQEEAALARARTSGGRRGDDSIERVTARGKEKSTCGRRPPKAERAEASRGAAARGEGRDAAHRRRGGARRRPLGCARRGRRGASLGPGRERGTRPVGFLTPRIHARSRCPPPRRRRRRPGCGD